MLFSDKLYDVLKWLCLIFLPAFGVFYALLANTFCWPYTEQILIVLGGFESFLGTLLGISCATYSKDE